LWILNQSWDTSPASFRNYKTCLLLLEGGRKLLPTLLLSQTATRCTVNNCGQRQKKLDQATNMLPQIVISQQSATTPFKVWLILWLPDWNKATTCRAAAAAYTLSNFTATSEDIRAVWKLFVPDVDLAVLAQEYDIQALSPKPSDPRQVLRMICSSKYPSPSSLATTLARILVCKPQSADCERLISAYNRLKSSQRNSLEHATIDNYLYKHATIDIIRSSPSCAALVYRERDKKQRHYESFQTKLVQ